MSFGEPTLGDINDRLDQIQRDLADLKKVHQPFSGEHVAQALGYASISSDLEVIKDALKSILMKLDHHASGQNR